MPATMANFDAKNLPEREEDIDFSDIYERNTVTSDDDFDTIVVVDGAPIVDKAKQEKLLTVLKKLFTKAGGDIKEGGIHMPMTANSSGNHESKGYLFIDFETPEAAYAAVKNLDGHKMSKTHQLSVNKFTDVEKYSKLNDTFVEPEAEEYVPREHVRSWLTDEQARDQFVMYRGDDVSIFWNQKTDSPDHVYTRQNWTETYVQWSPLGSYLSTFHQQGIALWGGPSWSKIVRFVHPSVKLIDFSPNERYLVTWSNEPISPSKIPEGSPNPFTDYDEGNQVVIWDVKTGALLRTFPITPNTDNSKTVRWPMFKWSASEKYFARIVPGQQLSIYEAPSMGLVDKKSIKIDGITDFEWSPARQDQSDSKVLQKEDVLAYWTPEIGNQPARVTLMTCPSKEIIRTKNLFNVTECKLHWQSKGHFLAVKVDRHTKTKKSTFTNIEIFRVCEKGIPVETLEIKEQVLAFAWEPSGERFAAITTSEAAPSAAAVQNATPATTKTTIMFYYLDTSKAIAGFKPLKVVEKKTANFMFWSPKGRHIVFATLRSSSVFDLEFWDLGFEPLSTDVKKDDPSACVHLLSTQEHYGVTDIEWDPTGRYVVTGSSIWRHVADHGFCVWDFKGQLLFKQNIEKFKQLLWRPRPKSLLSADQKKKIRKNLRQYSKVFEEQDLAAGDANTAQFIAARRKAVEEWYGWRKEVEKRLAEERKSLGRELRSVDDGKSEAVEEWIEEVIEETEEIL